MDRMAEGWIGSEAAGPGERLRLKVSVAGIVQGVGFRPFVYRLACREGLAGYILNNPQGVDIEVEGGLASVERFLSSLVRERPSQARIDSVVVRFTDLCGEDSFVIRASEAASERTTLVSPDIATCPDCLRELGDPSDRRHRYPFINCTNCGPRHTIIEDIPYDRQNTSMRSFAMCPECSKEYRDPLDRRFHAEPDACWVCGPQITLRESSGEPIDCRDPLEAARKGLSEGKVIGVKGLGGFHLAVDAANDAAVRLLRQRKRREEKPLAVMARDIFTIALFAEVGPEEERLLASPVRPIVLLPKRPDSRIAESVAPGNKYLGVMLPYTPIHHLLLEGDFLALVMTSGNLTEEPIAIDGEDALSRLAGIVDLYVDHNRQIVSRCDDSVARVVGGETVILRRSRGWVPLPIDLDTTPGSILACGAHLKNTIAVTRRNQVFLSQHIGDLENMPAYEFFTSTIDHMKKTVEVEPEIVAYDLHPDYLSTRFAVGSRIPKKVAVQHHHAHIASCLGEAGTDGPVIGFALDGTGYGPDATVWGGEILVATRKSFTRAGHLEQVAIPGGEAAIRQVWRMALSHLYSAYREDVRSLPLEALLGIDRRQIEVVLAILKSGFNSPMTSSCGRLFDAVSCLCGLRHEVKYEGQAALELEMAAGDDLGQAYPVVLDTEGEKVVIGVRGLVREIVRDVLGGPGSPGIGAGAVAGAGSTAGTVGAKFHNWLARSLYETACLLRTRQGLEVAALSGGCFQNVRLLAQLKGLLEGGGFRVITNHLVPANDGGISFGQAVVAAARVESEVSS
ncbi:MAG: carbamoyltransferase HypF [Candidatus Eisenbacteria bacterium]